jgi:hypothetical protein
MTIWKFPIETTDLQSIAIPAGSVLLSFQIQRGQPCMWAQCDPASPLEQRLIAVYGTGHPLPSKPGKYVGTYQLSGGALVFHVFDLGTEDR